MPSRDAGAPSHAPGVMDDAPSGVLYAAGFGVTMCAFYAANVGLGLDDAMFGAVVTVLAAFGYAVSYATRRLPSAGWSLAALAGSLIGVLLLHGMSGGGDTALFPSGAEGAVHRNLGVFLCWLLVLLSFAQLSGGWLLFTCVPAAAIMGLAGTVYSEPGFLWLYMVFVALGTFMIVHEHHTRAQQIRGQRRLFMPLSVRVVGQMYVAAACSVGAVAVARVVAEPMHAVGTALLPLGAVGAVDAAQQRAASAPRVVVSESSELVVGRGPASTSDQVLIRVRAEHGAYWRGASFDRYLGDGWRSSLPPPVTVGPRPSRGVPSAMFDPMNRSSVEVDVPRTARNAVPGASHILRQYVRLEGAGRFTDLYAAGEPRRYRISERALYGLPILASGDEAGRISLSRPIGAAYYEAESEIAEWSPESLRSAGTEMPDPLRAGYTSLEIPDPAVARLRQLALRVTRDASNDYDRVVALQEYISRTCVYNLEAPALSGDGDAVSQFLFESREGYCDLFGSALAVLCRTLDIPARVASGFTSGEFDAGEMEYVVRERDKHLWTEVWFAGTGWIPFDATTDAEDVTPSTAAERLIARGSWAAAIFRRGVLPPLGILGALMLLAYVFRTEVLSRLRWRRRMALESGLGVHAVHILATYSSMGRSLRRFGLDRRTAETPMEYAARLCSAFALSGVSDDAVSELTNLVHRARYAGDEMTSADSDRASALAREVRRHVRQHHWKRGAPGVPVRV